MQLGDLQHLVVELVRTALAVGLLSSWQAWAAIAFVVVGIPFILWRHRVLVADPPPPDPVDHPPAPPLGMPDDGGRPGPAPLDQVPPDHQLP